MHDSVDAETQELWEERLNRLYFACGCPEGSTGTLIALGAYVVAMAVMRPTFSMWSYLLLAVVAIIVGGAVGKFIGLRSADRRLQMVIRDIRNEWDARPREPEEPSLSCG